MFTYGQDAKTIVGKSSTAPRVLFLPDIHLLRRRLRSLDDRHPVESCVLITPPPLTESAPWRQASAGMRSQNLACHARHAPCLCTRSGLLSLFSVVAQATTREQQPTPSAPSDQTRRIQDQPTLFQRVPSTCFSLSLMSPLTRTTD